MSPATVTRVKKFKSRTVFQVDTECNFKKPLSIKILSAIHCKRPTLNDDLSFYIIYSPQTFKTPNKRKNSLKLTV